MAWTFDEIEQDWLAGSRIAVAPDEVVAAFARCERVLGRDWISTAKRNQKGSAPTLRVVTVGRQLAFIEDVANAHQLVDKLCRGDNSAFAELRGIHLLRSGELTRVELEPTTSAAGRERKCDFRIKRSNEPWVYVEVTQPDVSEAKARAQRLLESIVGVVTVAKKPFSLEVFFRREPAEDEVDPLIARIRDFCSAEHAAGAMIRQEIPGGMGILFLNERPAGDVAVDDHGDPLVPRLGASTAILGTGEPNRHVAVSVPYADSRAERFLRAEARQLPTDSPGLIMIEMGEAAGGIPAWEALLQRRFQPTMHTRVGGVCMFFSCLRLTNRGLASLAWVRLVPNKHARLPLPDWIDATCRAIHDELADTTGPTEGR
jgi:hypothetical protein